MSPFACISNANLLWKHEKSTWLKTIRNTYREREKTAQSKTMQARLTPRFGSIRFAGSPLICAPFNGVLSGSGTLYTWQHQHVHYASFHFFSLCLTAMCIPSFCAVGSFSMPCSNTYSTIQICSYIKTHSVISILLYCSVSVTSFFTCMCVWDDHSPSFFHQRLN